MVHSYRQDREVSGNLMKIADKRMKFSLRFCRTSYGKFVQRNVRARIERWGRRMEKQLDRTSNVLRSRQKIVYFKSDAKDEQNRSTRGRMQLPIWRNVGITSKVPPAPLNRRAKFVDETNADALNESILSSDLIESSCFVFDFVKRLENFRSNSNSELSPAPDRERSARILIII